jgi:hypothetical protein
LPFTFFTSQTVPAPLAAPHFSISSATVVQPSRPLFALSVYETSLFFFIATDTGFNGLFFSRAALLAARESIGLLALFTFYNFFLHYLG